MNEELILAEVNETTQDNVDIIQDSLVAEASEVEARVAEFGGEGNDDMPMEETTIDVLYVGPVEEIEIEVDEAIGWVPGDPGRHYGLPDRNDPDQHIIESITGLREELDEIESLKTAYSDKVNVANYYEWDGAAYDEVGYFVSIVPNTTKIKICDGSDILGVTIASAGFVGGQSAEVPRDNTYGLIATSGLVDVRCELEVNVGDYVVSNAQGYAKKADSNFGYRVLAIEEKNGVRFAIIALGVQADVINALGVDLNATKEQVDANYKNIISAVNVANQAYNKSTEAATISQEALKDALEALANSEDSAEVMQNALNTAQIASSVAAQARAISEGAATSAISMRNEAVEKANEALTEIANSREYFNSLATTMSNELDVVKAELTELEGGINDYKEEVEDTYVTRTDFTAFQGENTLAIAAVKKEASDTYATITSVAELTTSTSESIAGLRTEVQQTYATQTSLAQLKTDTTNAISASENKATETYATKTDLVSFQGDTNTAMARIEQKADANGAYIQSTVANIDKYSVGPYSQAYGFTLEQATSVLEEGMIYVPTINKTGDDAETYNYTDANGDTQIYTRSFLRGYLYQWGKLPNDLYGWITVDRDYDSDITEENADPTNEINTSAMAVYFNAVEIEVSSSNNYGYWYTDGDSVTDGYEPYTLYKWKEYTTKDDDGKDTTGHCWVPVATLAGNSQNRAVSQIRQDANSISLSVTDVKGDVADVTARVGDAESEVSSLTAWKNGGTTNEAIIRQTSNDNGASITISAYQRADDGTVEKETSLVLNSNADGSALCFDADNINFEAQDIDFSAANSVNFGTHKFNVYADEILFEGENGSTMKFDADNINFEGSEFAVSMQQSIDAKVSSKGDNNKGFGWSLDDEGFYLKQYTDEVPDGKDVFSVDETGHASMNSGTIAGWEIFEDELSKGDVILSTSDDLTYRSLITDTPSPIRINVGEIPMDGIRYYNSGWLETLSTPNLVLVDDKFVFSIRADRTVTSARLSGFGCSDPDYEDVMFGNAEIKINNNLISVYLIDPDPDENIGFGFTVEYICDDSVSPNFCLLNDGSLYANNAKLSGGTIAGLKIEENRITSSDGTGLIIKDSGISVTGENAFIQVGDGVFLSYNAVDDKIELLAKSHFALKGKTGASLDVMRTMKDEYCTLYMDMWVYDNDSIAFSMGFEDGYPISKHAGTISYIIESTTGIRDYGELNYVVHPGGTYELTPDELSASWYGTSSIYIKSVFLKGPMDQEYKEYIYSRPPVGYERFEDIGINQYTTTTDSDWYLTGNFIPDCTKGNYSLGRNEDNYRWDYIFTNHAVDGSDRKIKDNISEIATDFSTQLINGLTPKSYTLKTAKTPRTHYGFIAQEVEELLHSLGTSADEVGIVCKSKPGEPDGEDNYYSLNYTNLIAPMVSVIQQLSRRVEELENKLNTKQND